MSATETYPYSYPVDLPPGSTFKASVTVDTLLDAVRWLEGIVLTIPFAELTVKAGVDQAMTGDWTQLAVWIEGRTRFETHDDA